MSRQERERQITFRHGAYDMRSHAEQRWASIMDVLGVRWVYEPRTVNTRHGWYLPDFYLPACGIFVEVKGPTPSQEEVEKARDAEASTGCPVIFAYGDPEMLHGELFHGMVSYYAPRGPVDMPTTEIGELVRRNYDLHTYASFLTAGDRKPRPDVRQLGEIMQEVLLGMLPRDQLEQLRRSGHSPLNAAKEAIHGQHSLAEWFICQFVAVIEKNKRKEAA